MRPVPSTPVGKYYCRTLELQKFVMTGLCIFMQFLSHLLKNTFLSQPSTPCFPVLEPWHHLFGEIRVMPWWVWGDQGPCIQNYGKKTQSRHILEITCSKYTTARPVLGKQTDSRICYLKGWREIIWHPHPTTTAHQVMTWFTHCSEKFVKQQLGLNHYPIRFMIIHCQVSLKEQSSTPTKWENTIGRWSMNQVQWWTSLWFPQGVVLLWNHDFHRDSEPNHLPHVPFPSMTPCIKKH